MMDLMAALPFTVSQGIDPGDQIKAEWTSTCQLIVHHKHGPETVASPPTHPSALSSRRRLPSCYPWSVHQPLPQMYNLSRVIILCRIDFYRRTYFTRISCPPLRLRNHEETRYIESTTSTALPYTDRESFMHRPLPRKNNQILTENMLAS